MAVSLVTTHQVPTGSNYTSGISIPRTATYPSFPTVHNPSAPTVTPQTTGTNPNGWPTWQGLIGNSWEVEQAQAAMAAGMARQRGNFQATLRQGFIGLGAPSSMLGDNLSQYIDKDTMQAAINNKYSVWNQTALQAQKQDATNNAALAARGILSSGQTTKSAQDVINQEEQARYTALQQFLAQAQSGLMGLGDYEDQYAQGVAAAQSAAAARIGALYPGGLPGTSPLTNGGPFPYGQYDYTQIPTNYFTGAYGSSDYPAGSIPITTGPYGPNSWPRQR